MNKLVHAIINQNWQTVIRICETEEHLINTHDEDEWTPLLYAVHVNAPDGIMLKMIAKASLQNLEHERLDGSTILHSLAYSARVTPLRRALERTENANVKDWWHGRTPLYYCLLAPRNYDQHQEIAKSLMKFGASIFIKDVNGRTPLVEYDDNECSEYEESTRSEKKKTLKKLLGELSVPAEILARGESAAKVFEYEMRNGKITVVNARFMFLGKEGAGKTSCVKHILGKAFNKHEPSTDGIVTTTVFQTGEDGSKWEEQPGVDVCELTKQLRDEAIAEHIASELKEQENKQKTLSISTAPLTTVVEATGGKNIRENTQVSRGAGGVSTDQSVRSDAYYALEKKLPERIHKKVVDKLADNKRGFSNVGPMDVTSIWDYAGQMKYYIIHRFFLTGGSSYGVVFSVVDDLNALARPRDSQKGQFEMTNLQMILFWIRSIYEHAVLLCNVKDTLLINDEICSPPISLIATHKDQLPGNEKEKDAQIKTMYSVIFEEIKGTAYEKHVDRTIYAVDNTAETDEGIEKLKQNVGGYMKAMAKSVPTNWVEFQAKVQEVGKTRLSLSLNEVTKIADECGISKSTLSTVLDYLNDTGIILYSKTNGKLKNTVITNLRTMIDFLTKIITVVPADDSDKSPRLISFWYRLDDEGILEEKLLRHLWKQEIKKDASNFDIFLELMKIFGLVYEKNIGTQHGNQNFIVPSRMQVKKESLEVKKDEKQTVSVYVTPTDFLPDAIYNMLVVAFLDLMEVKGRSGEVELYQNCSDFDLDDDHVVSLGAVKIKNRHVLKLEISRRVKIDEHDTEEEALAPNPRVCIEVLNYLRQQLKSVYGTIEGIGYELCVICHACEPTLRPHLHKLDKCLKNDSVACGKKKLMATTRIKRLFLTDFGTKSINEIWNFVALQTLIVGLGTKELRRYFLEKTKLTKSQVKPYLTKEKQQGSIKNVDFGDQTTELFLSDDNIEAFDMNIMMKLIRYCCNNTYEEDFWENPPDDDNSELANLVRIYGYKKTVLDSSHSNRVTDEVLENRWQELTAMFKSVGVPVEVIGNYRNPRQYKEENVMGFNQTEVEEISNFQTLFTVVVDLGAVTMRKYILNVNKLKKKDVGTFLLSKQGNFKKGTLVPDQKLKMFTPNADIDQFDITILMSIIRNCCTIPDTFWTDPNVLTNLILIHQYRNGIVAHTPNTRMSTKDFETEWKKVESMLHAAGASKIDIEKYKTLRFTT